jgi:putative GTP pyrophosphokinase
MAWPTPEYSRNQVNKAGNILLRAKEHNYKEILWAIDVLDNWRSCHGYPINTFQATLRQKLSLIDSNAIVAQRLKRMFSIIGKLKRFEFMKLARMQDIGGLRAVVSTLDRVNAVDLSIGKSYNQA